MVAKLDDLYGAACTEPQFASGSRGESQVEEVVRMGAVLLALLLIATLGNESLEPPTPAGFATSLSSISLMRFFSGRTAPTLRRSQ